MKYIKYFLYMLKLAKKCIFKWFITADANTKNIFIGTVTILKAKYINNCYLKRVHTYELDVQKLKHLSKEITKRKIWNNLILPKIILFLTKNIVFSILKEDTTV